MAQSMISGEGVQVGSVCSPFGVLGAWTTANHDSYDPVGECYFLCGHIGGFELIVHVAYCV